MNYKAFFVIRLLPERNERSHEEKREHLLECPRCVAFVVACKFGSKPI